MWINLGPLLWHFHDVPGETSVELSWEVRVSPAQMQALRREPKPTPHRLAPTAATGAEVYLLKK